MSRIAVAAIVSTCAALAFGLGYQLGISRAPLPKPPDRARAGVTPPAPGGVGAAVHAALMNPEPLDRLAELARLLEPLGPGALDEVRAAYDAAVLDPGDLEMVLLAEWWARSDPSAALDWALDGRSGRHPLVVAGVVEVWARSDPEAAWQAVHANIRDTVLLRPSMTALARGWEEGGRPGLWDYLALLPQGTEQQRAMDALARRMVLREGADAALRWAEALPDDAADNLARPKLNTLRRVASAVAATDPARATDWAREHGEGRYGKGIYRRVAIRYAEEDGEAAMRWLSTLPAGRERDDAVMETYRRWSTLDREAASEWLRSAELEPWLDPAVVLFARSLIQESHQEALAWAARLSDAERRRETTIWIARFWLQAEPEAARSWLDRADLDEEARARILTPPPRLRRGKGAGAPQAD